MANSLKKIIPLFMGLCLALTVSAEIVNVNFFVGANKVLTCPVENDGSDFYIPDSLRAGAASPSSWLSTCRDYQFAGWKVGSRVTSDESDPVLVGDGTTNSIRPEYSTNLYAVFEHTDDSKINGYVRISSADNLEDNAQYLIVCYYVYGNQTQYYAMTNVAATYKYNGTTCNNRINAKRLYPRNGMIIAPGASMIWTLQAGATPGTWKWYNANADDGVGSEPYLYIGGSDERMMASAGTECVITATNGIFSIRKNGSATQLKYVDDEITGEEDYFITGGVNDYVIYLYKKESAYTCYPDCEAWTVNLDAMNGKVNGTDPAVSTFSITEDPAGDGVTLPGATVPNWTFYRWKIDEPLDYSESAPTDLIPAGSYSPLYNGVTLYAVYSGAGTITYYQRVTSLTAGRQYIITNYDQDEAISASWTSGSVWELNSITANTTDGIITNSDAEAAGNVVWTWTGSYFEDGDGYQLRYDRSTSYNPYTASSAGSPYFNLSYSGWRTYYLYDNGTSTAESRYYPSDNTRKFCFYEKKTRSAIVYTSYPHSTPYTIHLHACGGTVDGVANADRKQGSALATIKMPGAIPSTTCTAGEWKFVGWFPGEEKASFEHVEFTDIIAKDSLYFPTEDHLDLYAVYSKATDKFKIILGPSEIVSGDTYLITYYARKSDTETEKIFDWMLSSDAYDATHLKGEEGEAPENGEGFYMIARDSAVMWRVCGSGDYWSIRTLDKENNDNNHRYLSIGNGTTQAVNDSTIVRIISPGSSDPEAQEVNIGHASSNYWIYYENNRYTTDSRTWSNKGKMYSPWCYMYRRVKEYASWPHCDPFTVYFDACGGTAELPEGAATLTESKTYAGVHMPDAYANADCGKEGWSFAGWSTIPIEEETNLLSVEIYPPKSLFHPVSQNDTLYAVYYQKTNHYKRISTVGRLHTGVNYIIATPYGGSNLYALGNEQATSTTIASVSVTEDAAQIITSENHNIDWKLGGVKGEFEWYNIVGNDTAYLSLREPGEAVLIAKEDITELNNDNFDITYDGTSYSFRSCMNISKTEDDGSGEGRKFLALNGSNKYANVGKSSQGTLYIYRQQATYNSYPICIEDIDVIKWAKVDDTFNSVLVESYHLKGTPDVHGSATTTDMRDGTYLITYRNSVLAPCTNATVEWDGVTSRLRIPYIISDNVNLSDASVLNGTAGDCSDCDVYIMPKKTLTVSLTDTIRKVTVSDSATLNIANGKTLRTNILALYSEGDQLPPEVNLNASGSLDLRNTELYRDMRIDENRYYWFTLPYPAKLKEISYVNEAANGPSKTEGKIPRNRVDYWVKFYNGALRAADANGGEQAKTYWKQVAETGADYTLQPGQGYEIGIKDQAATPQTDGKYHTKRTIRFTMSPSEYAAKWLSQERNNDTTKTTAISPSTCSDPRNYVHAGWNLIGNPYLRTYNTSTGMTGFTCLRNGAWKQQKEGSPLRWNGFWELDEGRPTDVPYFTIHKYIRNYNDTRDSVVYEQVLVSDYGKLRPGQAVFVQINSGDRINFTAPKYLTPMPVRRHMMADEEEELPVRTGIVITGANRTDKTGFVFSDDYTTEYEIGADLQKMENSGSLNLYSLNTRQHKLAFNGLSEIDAIDPIPLGVSFPAAGEYTFAFDANLYNGNDIDTLMIIDYQEGTRTNLKYANYTFTTDKVNNLETRFAVLIRLAKKSDYTDIEDLFDEEGPRKVIRDNHLFIITDDKIYNATGARVR